MAHHRLGCGIEFQKSKMNKKTIITALLALVAMETSAK